MAVVSSGMDAVLSLLSRSLRADGVLYASFNVGDGEVFRDGLMFTSYDERVLGELGVVRIGGHATRDLAGNTKSG